MPPTNLARLRGIKTLPQLVTYLREDLDWPIESDDTEDITFDYSPEELGLDKASAVNIKEIKQLRPLAGNQPWGIFFINFEKKRLPVVAMRRILRALVLKKRASANKAERQAWHPHDLLFISAYGEEAERAITFAHFVDRPEQALAELRVLGWDDDDTPLHADYVARMLQENLRWDAKVVAHPDLWRQQWAAAFLIRHGHVIRTSEELSEALAVLARRIRTRIRSILRMETGDGQMRTLQRAFRIGLIHDLDDDGFADMFAQTVTYGLFSVSVRRTLPGDGTTAVTKDDVPNLIFTSPFLKDMLGVFLGIKSRKGAIDFDELGVSDVTDLLTSKDTHMEVVLADFNNKTRGEDPVIHFYEHFLTAYNKALKIQRGVFYTPQPVVSYIVRSVHELLQTEFGLAHGLADTTTWGAMLKKHPGLKLPPKTDEHDCKETISADEMFVQILDPATGTATFLVEVIDVIHKHLEAKWRTGGLAAMPDLKPQGPLPRDFTTYWNLYVPQALLPRLHAFELMMAPYAIAHMKVGLKLSETGYRFATEERARIYLTNALEPKVHQLPTVGFEALATEAAAVNEIKWYKRFTVIVGNPPYAGVSANMAETAQRLVGAYKSVDGIPLNERKVWLQDDYVKFTRVMEMTIQHACVGVVGVITNHGYLNNPTFRGMRRSLMQTFQKVYVLDLHGNSNINEVAPNQSRDENVFDIMQGVSVGLFTRAVKESKRVESVLHDELWGLREHKYKWLSTNSQASHKWTPLTPNPPHYFFVPRNESAREEYECGWSLPTIMPASGVGMITARDALTIEFDADTLWSRVARFSTVGVEDARSEYGLGKDVQSWKVSWAQKDVRVSGPSRDLIRPVLYRPFDKRFTYYTGQSSGFICRPVVENMRHMIAGSNLGIVTCRQIVSESWRHVLAADGLTENCLASNQSREGGYLFPVYIYPASNDSTGQLFRSATKRFSRRPNLASTFVTAICGATKLEFVDDGKGNLKNTLGPEDIFHYAYAVFHSPGYRTRYAEFLKIDFPRLPLTGNLDLFRALARLGGEIVALHLLESPALAKPRTEWVGGRNPEVEKPTWSHNTVWVDKAQTIGFKGVPEAVWNFHIGGYQVCEKWLKDRKGRVLTKEDITHYQKVVVALAETIRLMAEIDEVIATHGGWPGAFASSTAPSAPDEPSAASSKAGAPKPVPPDLRLQTEDELPLG